MFTRKQRRGVGLAATCAAVAMTVGLATPAFAATTTAAGDEPLVLTPEQIDELSARAQADVYGDLGETEESDPAPSDDAAASETSEGGNTLEATTEAATWKHTVRASVEGDYGMVTTVPIAGAGDDYFAIDSLGLVQRRTADGAEVWRRDNTSWYAEWGVKPVRPWQPEPYPARIVVGYNAVSPFSPVSQNGYATGDLTGDGVDDLVFSAEVGAYPYRPMVGTPSTGTFVTIVDGATGGTLWWKLYAAVYALDLVDGTLVVADSPAFNINSPAGSKLLMTGLTFAPAGDGLAATTAWTYDPAAPKASGWADLEPIGDGLLAVSWDRRKDALETVPSGNTLVLDAATGEVRWTATDRMYSRQLRLDASRERLVALEQSDPNEGVQYQVVTYDLADGARAVLDTRVNAMPLASAIGDLGGSDDSEIVVNEATVDEVLRFNSTTTRALDGDSGSQLWSRTLKRDPENSHDGILAWGVAVAGERVIVNSRDDAGYEFADNRSAAWFGRISVLAGNNGAVKWEHTGTAASQLWSQVVADGKDVRVRTVDTLQNVHEYNLGSGKQSRVTPLPADSSSATAIDITGDGADDLVVGGNSQGVFAYDGRALVGGERVPLWSATVAGSVHEIVRADVTGDGHDELVVAADTAVNVIEASSGEVLRTIDGGGEFVRTVGAADLDGDGKAEIVVPTDAVRAYRGDGKLAWTYAPGDGLVFGDVSIGDGRVYASYGPRDALALDAPGTVGGVALDAASGTVTWQASPAAPTELGFQPEVWAASQRAATFASPGIPYADGHAVVYAWIGRTAASPYAPMTFMEIRDGRTGEVLHTATLGGPNNLNNWVIGPDGLVAGTTAVFRNFGADGEDASMPAFASNQVAGFATTPSGEPILVASSDGGLGSIAASALLTSTSHVSMTASINVTAGRELELADLDGDGRLEAISLSADARGADRTAERFGSGFSSPFTAMRQFVVTTIDAR